MLKKVPVKTQRLSERISNFKEVCLGYAEDEAIMEASRCLQCQRPQCISKCPVKINIPLFIKNIRDENFIKAAEVIAQSSSLPGICGRVCPQELQCESKCVLGKKGEAIAIGKLERFIADWCMDKNEIPGVRPEIKSNGIKVAIAGSGPAGLTCAGKLAKLGYAVTVFEALHKPGGVLAYGIPEFRLPKATVVNNEINNLLRMGVKLETNVIVGKTITIDELFNEENFKAIFIGTGAGLPKFMGIKGENLNGVFSANEFLTRNNLMMAFKMEYKTPIKICKKTVVIGGGNVAIDASRVALRLGSEVYIMYRRTEREMPARLEEINNAKEEGVNFMYLSRPVEIIGNENGEVTGLKCVKLRLTEKDEKGRYNIEEIPDTGFMLEADQVIIAIGTSPNKLIPATTIGIATDNIGRIIIDKESCMTSRIGVFAGGDAVSGASTVISAMEAGKKAAMGIDKYIMER
jgi:glutamate synthase (NADPH/NADH) small chain